MICPHCKKGQTRVQFTRKYENHVHRVRYCPICLRGFETDEQIDIDTLKSREESNADARQPR